MTIKEARCLGVGDRIIYQDTLTGTVIGIKFQAVRVQWKDSVAMDVPFDHEVLALIHKQTGEQKQCHLVELNHSSGQTNPTRTS